MQSPLHNSRYHGPTITSHAEMAPHHKLRLACLGKQGHTALTAAITVHHDSQCLYKL